MAERGLFEQIRTDGQVAAALVLPLASNVIVLGTFRRSPFSDFGGDVSHAVKVTGESD